MNPFKDNPFKNLSKGQKYAAAGGTLLVTGYLVYRHHSQTGSWNPWSAGAATSATSTGIDPITGLPYSQDNMVDPVTNMTYLAEAEQYGSVATAESSVSAFGTGSGTGSGVGVNPASPSGGSGSTGTTNTYASNQDWVQAVVAGLTEVGYAETTVNEAIQGYFASQPLQPQEYRAMKVALSEFGPPPSGSFQLLQAPSTGTGKTMAKVPDVTGIDVEQATGIIQQVGLKASGPPGVKDKIHVVTSTTPPKDKEVTQGTTVVLHYKTENESSGHKSGGGGVIHK